MEKLMRLGMIVLFALLAGPICAEDEVASDRPLLIVTDSYEPFIMPPGASLKGLDVEVTAAVFKQMGIAVEIKIYPWKRCQKMVHELKADAILDAAKTPERLTYMYFPEEPLSESSLVIFFHKQRKPEIGELKDLKAYRIGAQLGYEYQAPLGELIDGVREDVATMEQNFQKLINGRIDLTIENRSVGLYRADRFGVRGEIAYMDLPDPILSRVYLGFAMKPEYARLAAEFSRALVDFKMTPAYREILGRYGQIEPE